MALPWERPLREVTPGEEAQQEPLHLPGAAPGPKPGQLCPCHGLHSRPQPPARDPVSSDLLSWQTRLLAGPAGRSCVSPTAGPCGAAREGGPSKHTHSVSTMLSSAFSSTPLEARWELCSRLTAEFRAGAQETLTATNQPPQAMAMSEPGAWAYFYFMFNVTKGMKRKEMNDNHKPSSTKLKCLATIFQKRTCIQYYNYIFYIYGAPSHTAYWASSLLSVEEKLSFYTYTHICTQTHKFTCTHIQIHVHTGVQMCAQYACNYR